jgi:DNA repair photolyase
MKTQSTPQPPAPAQLNLLPGTAPLSPIGFWNVPAAITENNFIYKSLSNFAFNLAVGCSHSCQFCYVPSAATRKQAPALARYGVQDPDAEWGDYVLLRPWDEKKFLASLAKAENTPRSALKRDGNRAIIYCSTTDAYQAFHHPDPEQRRILADHASHVVRRSLELIRDHSTLNVRILTRSPLARRDFDLYQSLGQRLTFGMSLPTLRNDVAKIYEPKAPAPSQRLATLQAAKAAGLNVFVAMAPTYPECDATDLEATLRAVAELDPITIYHEPINIRAENVARIEAHAKSLGAQLNTSVFATTADWRNYALESLLTVERLSSEVGVRDRLHLWPDQSLGSKIAMRAMSDPARHQAWLQHWWSRISEWPGTRKTSADRESIVADY